ncbi:MAG: pantetheine-phosphate adenylyltransferase [Mogibacterium sp.]|nr:pantetheine-phosphate adenylyltransferase [Mogibacterium sp.]
MERKALYAGSFDPITNGHLNIIERAARIFDSLTVAVAVNYSKHGMFTTDERMEIVKRVTSHIPNVNVIKLDDGLLADHVNANGYSAYIRGLRSTADFESELQMAHMNARLFTGDTETVFLMTDPQYSFVSSSLVKEVASLGGSVEGLVPEYVIKKIRDKISQEEQQ